MLHKDCSAPYELLLNKISEADVRIIDNLTIGLTWITCTTNLADKQNDPGSIGLAMALGGGSRTLPWPGTVAGKKVSEVATWLQSWNNIEAAVGLAAVNASINTAHNGLLSKAEKLVPCQRPNLAVFEHFRPRLHRKKVVLIGHYPGISECLRDVDVTILERIPGAEDLPDAAAEYVIPSADWVFITASSLVNKTFPRLAELAEDAHSVLMGPSTPWLTEWADFGIDYIAGVTINSAAKTQQIAAEGGGTRLFEGGVDYALAKLSA